MRENSGWLREIAPDAPLGAQVHSRVMAHPLLFFSSSPPLLVGKYCFEHLKFKRSICYSSNHTIAVVMDPLDFLATHSQSYWTRFNNSTRCFEVESGMAEAVQIVDVPAAVKPHLTAAAAPLRKQDCTNLKLLEDYLAHPANANYSCRLM